MNLSASLFTATHSSSSFESGFPTADSMPYYELKDYDRAEQALKDYETAFPEDYMPHALRGMMLITEENTQVVLFLPGRHLWIGRLSTVGSFLPVRRI